MAGTNGGKVCPTGCGRSRAETSSSPKSKHIFKRTLATCTKVLTCHSAASQKAASEIPRRVSCIRHVMDCMLIILDQDALKALPKGSAVIIFTPDSTHFPIASEALNLGHHVLVTKPATQKLEDHQTLIELAKEKGLVCFVEHHKRFE